MTYLAVLIVLFAVVLVVTGPFRRDLPAALPAGDGPPSPSTRLLELDAARDAKYREIRDADLDHETGKLSDEDYAAIDATLRAEAVEILSELDELWDRVPAALEREDEDA